MPGGAPRGNQNARKHGFYSKVLKDRSSRHVLDQAACLNGIDEEIALLRFRIRDILQKEPDNVRLQLEAAKILSNLLKTRWRLGSDKDTRLEEGLRRLWTEVAVPFGMTSFPNWPPQTGQKDSQQ